ncbi:MAG TPA: energy-coupling factor ABC transporter permease [Gemmataceae bacterium]|nr:energy-coupling factor ABC transporter permease [Gemmataceae bacterium]
MGAAPVSFGLLWAMHISDGLLTAPWMAAGFVLSGLLALLASYRVRDEEIPRIAVLSAAFFVATLMHLPLGLTSVHLLLNGLVGVVLGRRAPLAILIGLTLQAVLLGHGGFTTIGVNTCVMALPALLAAALFAALRRLPWFGRGPNTTTWLCGFLLGMISVLATLVLNAAVLLWGGAEDWRAIVQLVFYSHLPIVIVEGVVLGFTVNFLIRVKPEMLGLKYTPPAVLMAIFALLMTANGAYAHRLQADYFLVADRQVRIESFFDDGRTPQSATIEVRRPDGRLLAEGSLDKGCFVFAFEDAEPLEVTINAGAGHRKSFVIPRAHLEQATTTSHEEIPKSAALGPFPGRETHDALREQIKDALVGISFLFSVAAFLLSWRINRRLRRNERDS